MLDAVALSGDAFKRNWTSYERSFGSLSRGCFPSTIAFDYQLGSQKVMYLCRHHP